MVTPELNSLSKLLLVASDAAYAGNLRPIGARLAEYRDTPAYDYSVPYQIPEGFTVDRTAEDPVTGFKFVAYRRSGTGPSDEGEIIVAMAGTDGSNAVDWAANLRLGWDQWTAANTGGRAQVLPYLEELIAADFKGKIHFTGQSLGGALAEYAAYEFYQSRPGFASQVSLVTFNGLGSRDGLTAPELGNQNSQLIEAFDTAFLGTDRVAHYFVTNDLVHRLGGGHLGHAARVYELRFEGSAVDPLTGKNKLLHPVEAHRIETGFYKEFAFTLKDFGSARQTTMVPIDTTRIQPLVGSFIALFNNRGVTPQSAQYRLKAALINAINQVSDTADIDKVLIPVVDALYFSGVLNRQQHAALGNVGAKELKALAGSQQRNAARQLLTALAIEKFEANQNPSAEDVGSIKALLPTEYKSPEEGWYTARTSMGRMTQILAGLDLIDPDRADDRELLARYGLNATTIADQIYTDRTVGQGWPRWLLNSIGSRPEQAGDLLRVVTTATILAAQRATASVGPTPEGKTFAKEFWDSLWSDINADTSRVGAAIANGVSHFLAKFASPIIDINKSFSFKVGSTIINGFDAALAQPDALVAPELMEGLSAAREAIRIAVQRAVVRQGQPGNPFDSAEFDPDESSLELVGLGEGAVRTLTAYLPFNASPGGQKVRLTLGGTAASKLTVMGNGAYVLEQDGTFSVVIPEGQREISFSIAALKDIDANDTLTLSAQLVAMVDGTEVATHVADEELSLTLSAVIEQAPDGGREIHGDWAAKVYVDEVTGQPYVQWDDLGNIERQPGTVSTGDVEIDQLLGGSSGADRVFTGDYDERAYTYGGNDVVFGSAASGNIVFSGAGDDWVEGRGNTTVVDPEQRSFAYQGREVSLGDDVILGGGGNDTLYGDSEAIQDQLNDPTVATTALPGDWINGGTGDDRLYGTAGHDVLLGGTGKDLLQGGAGKDVLLGDENFGLAIAGNYWRVMHPFFTDQTFSGFELGLFPVYNYSPLITSPGDIDPNVQDPYVTYYKDGGDDILIGGAGRDILIGQFGHDTLYGGEDGDVLAGWEGNDQILGGDGDDLMAGDFGRYELRSQRLLSAPNVGIAGLVGSSSFNSAEVDQAGNDYLDAGAGADTVFGEGGNDVIMGRGGDDTLYGDALYLPDGLHGHDTIDGGEGNDSIFGNGGNDRIFGGADGDVIDGGAGDDIADGGTGDDTIRGSEGNDVLKGAEGLDRIDGGDGNDTLHGGTGNDELAGGAGNDRLYGELGADRLDGDAGDDQLYGGSGEDVLSGGDGNDLIDGGAGIDIARGGAGDDTYVVAFGYGRDIIEDTQGRNRLSFAPGISASDLAAELESTTLAATITFSGIGDAVAFNAGEARIDGIDFAGGTSWGRREFLGFMPALLAQGTAGNDSLTGIEQLRNTLRGFDGRDSLIGSGNDDALEGGDDADALDGGGGGDRYFYTGEESGVDQLVDSGVSSRAYLEWYYSGRGVADWEERGLHGGRYRAEGAGEVGDFLEYFDTYEQAVEAYPSAAVSYVEPLADVAPLVSRNDVGVIAELVAAGVLDSDTVEFGEGIALSDLALTVTMNGADAEANPGQPWHRGGILSVRWQRGGFDLSVPDVRYGFDGSNLFTDGDPDAAESTGWRGYRLGEGIETFVLGDGTTYTLEAILQQAEVVPVFELVLERGSGAQVLDLTSYNGVRFGGGIAASEVSITREGLDLLAVLQDGSASVRVPDWFATPPDVPQVWLQFAGDAAIGPDAATTLALTQEGSEFGDELFALDGFANTLHGGAGDDLLFGGDRDDLLAGGPGQDFLQGDMGDDRYVFEIGGGEDWITENLEDGADGFDTLAFGPGILSEDVSLSQDAGGLRIALHSGEAVYLGGWFDEPDGTVERIEFADGTQWDAAAVEAHLPDPGEATEEDDELLGRTGDDVIDGLAGADVLYGFAGNDLLRGGDGEDFVGDWRGNNLLDGGEGDDEIYADIGSNFVIGGLGDDSIEHFGTGVVAFNRGDGNDTVHVWNTLVLSLGGGVSPHELGLSADGEDLVLDIAEADSVRLTRQFAEDPSAWPQVTLQLFGSVHRYDFNAVIADFRDAVDEDPGLERMPLAASLAAHQTDASDSAALGGELAWQYASAGNVAAMTDEQVRAVLANPGFGIEAQPISAQPHNEPPQLASPIPDLSGQEDAAFTYTIEAGAFTDPDAGDTLALSATRADGGVLPTWLAFDASTGTFGGTPVQADVGSVDIRVTASDPAGEEVADVFRLTVTNINDAPIEAVPLGDQSFEAGTVVSFTIPAATFFDEDGEPLALTARLFDGTALPAWLAFDSFTGTFMGAPALANMGISHVEVTATDSSGAAASSDFGLVIRAPAGASVTGGAGDDVLHGGTGDETLTAKGGSDYLYGDAGNDLLKGGGGNDVLQGGAGSDVLRGGVGQNILDGGAGDDLIYGGQGSAFLIGGTGNDTLRVGRGSDVIGFNAGDGIDTVYGGRDGGNTLSFGGGIGYDDLSLSKVGKDLVVKAGENDKVVLKNWYGGNHSVVNLQVLIDACDDFDAFSQDPLHNKKVQRFDFLAMVDAYDSARQETPGLSSWALTNALLQFHLSGSDDFALGGDLAYWYSRNRTLAGISLSAAQQVIGDPSFGSDAQTLRPFNGLQEGFVKLT